MSITTRDLDDVTPDADGTLRHRRSAPQPVQAGKWPFVGACIWYQGKAEDVGQGDLTGWELLTDADGRFVKVATQDSEVGAQGGSDDGAHTHTFSDTSGVNSSTESTQTGSGDTVADSSHTHSVSGTTGTVVLAIDPLHYGLYLIKFIGG